MTRQTQAIVGAAVFLAVFTGWWLLRSPDDSDKRDRLENTAVAPMAAVVRVESRDLGIPLTLAGAFKPFQDVDVHAKVSGYIRAISVDVGSHVTDGQILAILEVPELAAQLSGATAAVRRSEQEIHKAQGDLERAMSSHAAAHSMYDRLKQASEQRAGLVAEQEVEDAQAKDLESEAGVSSAQSALNAAQQSREMAEANQKQFSALSGYTRIAAPFAGVVTARYADTGALIAAGTASGSQSSPVVRIAQVSVLRLVLPIPESVAGEVRIGDPVKVHVPALNQDFVGKVSRFADSLDPQTRTMETEIDFQNQDGKLLPGMYVQATLALAEKKDMLTVPLEAVQANGADGTVLLLNTQNILEERKVRLGLQGSTRIEVRSGLAQGDRVVVGSLSEFRSGMKVRPKEIDASDPGAKGER